MVGSSCVSSVSSAPGRNTFRLPRCKGSLKSITHKLDEPQKLSRSTESSSVDVIVSVAVEDRQKWILRVPCLEQ